MGWKTVLASAVIPGLGQVINDQFDRAVAVWTGLVLSVILFPLPVFGSITFAGIYIAGIIDAYDPDNHFDMIHLKTWKEKSWDKIIDRLKQNSNPKSDSTS